MRTGKTLDRSREDLLITEKSINLFIFRNYYVDPKLIQIEPLQINI